MRRLCRGRTRDGLGRGWRWVRKRWHPQPEAPDEDTGLGPSGELGSENVEKAQDPPSWLRRQHFIHLLFVLTANSRPRKGRRSSLGEKDGGERSLGPPGPWSRPQGNWEGAAALGHGGGLSSGRECCRHRGVGSPVDGSRAPMGPHILSRLPPPPGCWEGRRDEPWLRRGPAPGPLGLYTGVSVFP